MSEIQDQEHLKLLAIFHYVAAGLGALFSCFPILHVILGIVMLSGAMDGPNGPPRAFGWIFILFPACFILFGWATALCVAYAGHCLQRRKNYIYCLVIAGVACMFAPLGTALGVFTIIVLLRESVKELFESNTPVSERD